MSIVIIPAYNPDSKLIELIGKIKKHNINKIIVVNDGSNISSEPIFEEISKDVILLNHEQNLGKGEGIKTGLKYIKQQKIEDKILIMDADGQHKIEDGIKLLKELDIKKKQLILGKRNFGNKIPIKSKLGNIITKYFFRLFTGKWIEDTQTGLRAFGTNLIDDLIKIQGSRYEYEINMLIQCIKNKVEIKEVDITTIYIEGNKSSHFRAVIDSIRIYSTMILFAGSAFLSFLLDYLSFLIIFYFGKNTVLANIIARIISGSFNFLLNSKIVFNQNKIKFSQILQYIILATLILAVNTRVLLFINSKLNNVEISKIITEIVLFLINYIIQKIIIFRKGSKKIDKKINNNVNN